MKAWFCVLFLSCFLLCAEAQFRSALPATWESRSLNIEESSYYSLQSFHYKTVKSKSSGLRLAHTSSYSGENGTSTYWAGQVTSQSYGKGKWGTFYYWDAQGNLRDMKGFIDIAGKNKRGLKLVFPWR